MKNILKSLGTNSLCALVFGLLAILCVDSAWAAAAGDAAVPDTARQYLGSAHADKWWWVAPISSIIALVMAFVFFKWIVKQNPGTPRMVEIAGYVKEGAYAFLKQQYRTVMIFFVVVAVLLSIMAAIGIQHPFSPVAFVMGGFLSGLAGFFGMKTATLASNRTAQAASESLNRGLIVAFRAGSIMGLCVVGLGMLGVSSLYFFLTHFYHAIFGGAPLEAAKVGEVMLSMALGASSMALFARVGGGIYTKAADVGADLVGKVEAGIPEDDPRNPATIADNVGDNVGDVAGMGADLFESYIGSVLATVVLGVAAAADAQMQHTLVVAPMALAGIGILLSIAGVFVVKLNRDDASEKELLPALAKGVNFSSALIVLAAAGLTYALDIPWGVFGSTVVGLVLGIIIGKGTEIYTAADYKPTQNVARAAVSGTGPAIIAGIAEGMLSTWIPIIATGCGTIMAFGFSGGFSEGGLMMGLYGVAIAAVGMLSTLGITLATDAYGPIADNAGGNAEMSHLPPEVRKRTDALDSLGNTTAAIGKGFAIGSAALTALALMASYLTSVETTLSHMGTEGAKAPVAGQVVYQGRGLFHVPAVGGPAGSVENGLVVDKDVRMALDRLVTDGQTPSLPARTLESVKGTYYVDMMQHKKTGKIEMLNDANKATGEYDVRPFKVVASSTASQFDITSYYDITLLNPKVLTGVIFGVMLVFVFSALTMKAVGRAAEAMVQEVRRQFREMPGIMQGTQTPDYALCVGISTKNSLKEMVLPTLLALIVPILTGIVLGVSGVMGLLIGGMCCGFAAAVFMANSGGSWDNAKKYIESGQHGGKGSDAHKAAVVGDTVGDPFKDTSGPSLNILIKLMTIVSVVFAGLTVKFAPLLSGLLGIGN